MSLFTLSLSLCIPRSRMRDLVKIIECLKAPIFQQLRRLRLRPHGQNLPLPAIELIHPQSSIHAMGKPRQILRLKGQSRVHPNFVALVALS